MKRRGRPIVSIAGRITLFQYLFTLLVMLLYIQGSFQNFTDESLIKLLVLFKYSSLVYIASAITYIVILIAAGRNTGRRLIMRIALTLVGVLVTSALFFIVEIIITGLEPVI